MDVTSIEPAVLITIPLSHYCEKARWALDRCGLPYREEPHVPLLHRVAASRAGGGTVPVLMHESRRFVDSGAIMRHAADAGGRSSLYPQDPGLRTDAQGLAAHFDIELGPHTRRWAYAQLLSDRALLRRLWACGVPRLEAALLPLIVPIVCPLVRRAYRISPDGAQRSLERVRGVFRNVEERLRDGRRFLIGDQFTVADLTFAALAAPAVFPAGCRAVLPDMGQISGEMRGEIARFRDTPAGQFALRLYAQERLAAG